jgi:predicted dehydrogenase
MLGLVLALVIAAEAPAQKGPLRVGLVGLDSSHAVEFTALLNDPARRDHVAGARVVAAFRGGSPDVEASAKRIDRFTAELRDRWKVELVATLPELLPRVDAVIITSVDGRAHLPELRQLLPTHKPVFIDKPLAASLADAREIARLARAAGTPVFSSSSLRFVPEIATLTADPRVTPLAGAIAWGPAPTEPHHPDLFWYGVHEVEILYTLLGSGCTGVARVTSPGADLVVGRWRDGRLGTLRGGREGTHTYGAVAFGKNEVLVREVREHSYAGLLREVVRFFQTGTSPVPLDTTLEMMAFMEAADASKARGGLEVPLSAPPRPR